MEVLSVIGKVTGVSKVKDASGKMKRAINIQKVNVDRFEEQKRITCKKLNEIEMRELEILQKFETFSDTIERIQKRPEFKGYKSDNIDLSQFDMEELRRVSSKASVYLEKVADTATGITSGAALVIGGTVLGPIAAVSSIVSLGEVLSYLADKTWKQTVELEKKLDEACVYLKELYKAAKKLDDSLIIVNASYKRHFEKLRKIVWGKGKKDWDDFDDEEKLITQNTILLAQLLFELCKVKLILKDEVSEYDFVNDDVIDKVTKETDNILRTKKLYI